MRLAAVVEQARVIIQAQQLHPSLGVAVGGLEIVLVRAAHAMDLVQVQRHVVPPFAMVRCSTMVRAGSLPNSLTGSTSMYPINSGSLNDAR